MHSTQEQRMTAAIESLNGPFHAVSGMQTALAETLTHETAKSSARRIQQPTVNLGLSFAQLEEQVSCPRAKELVFVCFSMLLRTAEQQPQLHLFNSQRQRLVMDSTDAHGATPWR
jgi:hypothetical protein